MASRVSPRRAVGLALALAALAASGGATFAAFSAQTSNTANSVGAAADWTAPSASRSVIARASGGSTGTISAGHGHYVYAEVTDSGNPPSGVASARPDVSAVTAGETSATLSSGPCPCTVDGLSYNRRSGLLTADNPLSEGAKSYSITSSDSASPVNTGTDSGFSVTVVNSGPVSQSVTTSAWQVSDQSSGTATDVSDALSFEDLVTVGGIARATTFNTAKYRSLKFAGPLPTGYSTSAVNFNFSFDSNNSGTSCFYFDVRAASTGSLIATKGSAASPLGCVGARSGSLTTATPLPEVSTSAIANDLEIRVYETNSGGTATNTDLTTVSGTMGPDATPFTLYETTSTDTNGATPVVRPWSLAALGGDALLTSPEGWNKTFSTSKYLKLTVPAYVPPGATAISATFNHTYKGLTTAPSCYYFEVYNAGTLISTHGSTASPYSCNSTESYRTDTVALPAVDTVTEANNLSIRLYFKSDTNTASNRRTYHDRATVTLTYTG